MGGVVNCSLPSFHSDHEMDVSEYSCHSQCVDDVGHLST
jgi:uncharacterized protein YuzB (UPF0349 family)